MEYISFDILVKCDNCNRVGYKEGIELEASRCYSIGCILCKRFAKHLGYEYSVGEIFDLFITDPLITVKMRRRNN